MSNIWYVKRDDQCFGPSSHDEILQSLRQGILTKSDLIANSPEGSWTTISERAEFRTSTLPLSSLAAPAVPPKPSVPDPQLDANTQSIRHLPPDVRQNHIKTLTEDAYWAWQATGFLTLFAALLTTIKLWNGDYFVGAISGIGLFVLLFAMGYLHQSRTKELNGYSDDLLVKMIEDHREVEKEKKKRRNRNALLVGGAAAALAVLVLANPDAQDRLLNIASRLTNSAKCEILNKSIAPMTFANAAEPDFGFIVNIEVRNIGAAGNIEAFALVSTAEGELKKSRKIYVPSSSSQKIEIQFPEPTVNSTLSEVRFGVSCTPN